MSRTYKKLAALADKALEACAELEAYEKETYDKTPEEEKEYTDVRLDSLARFLDEAVGQYEWIKEVAAEAS